MAPMRTANRGDVAGVARRREPVVDRSTDRSAAERRLSRALVTGDEQHDTFTARDRYLQPTVNRLPCPV